jgi:hypothetical protein
VVIKGQSRAGAGSLSLHLLRADTNERVEVLQLRGVAGADLRSALCEMEAVASGSRCKKPLYHVAINAAPDESRTMTPEEWALAVDRLENELGMEGHARVVVQHHKKDRTHTHVVWNRVDVDTMQAAHLSWNYRAHEQVARELEREFGHRHVQGVHIDRDPERERPQAKYSHAEWQMQERGVPIDQVREDLTAAWEQADSGRAWKAAIEDMGYVLAKGARASRSDKKERSTARPPVVVDAAGEVHAPRRRIKGATAKDIMARLADIDPAILPTVEEVRAALERHRLEEAIARENRMAHSAFQGGHRPVGRRILALVC